MLEYMHVMGQSLIGCIIDIFNLFRDVQIFKAIGIYKLITRVINFTAKVHDTAVLMYMYMVHISMFAYLDSQAVFLSLEYYYVISIRYELCIAIRFQGHSDILHIHGGCQSSHTVMLSLATISY